MFYLFLDNENGALTLISVNNPDFLTYIEGLTEIFKGKRKECLEFLDDYLQENFLPDGKIFFTEIN